MTEETVPFRDFDAEASDEAQDDLEPSGTFQLGGRTWRVRNKDEVPFGFLNLFGKGKIIVGPFFKATIHPADLDEFMKMVEEPDGPLTPRSCGKVMDHVAELVLDRPTVPADGSSSGSKPTGAKSGAGSSSRGTRQRRSA